ncbi:hypothetical protein BCF46_2883 [Litoreibacter meonggei]|uniref:Sulfotransferase family protein n=1 Tax=Litoreibacter meonggei TaxID=1049199 RepID=A0A497VLK3_9RHOB|nr:hypothetical protein [Litoreibacter meonggei]RLJ41095.1 hypothetical protein BCF46_2883 [Litoreibacter meonggei]
MLHIGKTGGSYLRSVLRHNEARWTRPLHLLGHGATLNGTAKRFGADRQLAFVVRDPLSRFSSAFYSRQRQGRPTYNSQWSAEEAAAFHWFETAEDLAIALTSPQEREKSAALFTFHAIQHLKANLRHYLGGVNTLLAAQDNIAICVDLPDLDAHLPKIMACLGVPDHDMPPNPKTHKAPNPIPNLSPRAEAALRAHWAEEFELYETACDIARQLGFGPAGA